MIFNGFRSPTWKCHSAKNRSSKTITVTSVCTYSMSHSSTCHNPYIAIFELYTVTVLLIEYEEKLSSFRYCCGRGGSLHHGADKKTQNPQCSFPLKTFWKKHVIYLKTLSDLKQYRMMKMPDNSSRFCNLP